MPFDMARRECDRLKRSSPRDKTTRASERAADPGYRLVFVRRSRGPFSIRGSTRSCPPPACIRSEDPRWVGTHIAFGGSSWGPIGPICLPLARRRGVSVARRRFGLACRLRVLRTRAAVAHGIRSALHASLGRPAVRVAGATDFAGVVPVVTVLAGGARAGPARRGAAPLLIATRSAGRARSPESTTPSEGCPLVLIRPRYRCRQ